MTERLNMFADEPDKPGIKHEGDLGVDKAEIVERIGCRFQRPDLKWSCAPSPFLTLCSYLDVRPPKAADMNSFDSRGEFPIDEELACGCRFARREVLSCGCAGRLFAVAALKPQYRTGGT